MYRIRSMFGELERDAKWRTFSLGINTGQTELRR